MRNAVKAATEPVAATPTKERDLLYRRFQDRIAHNPKLDRTLVSFQANKRAAFYSWFKYKEAFSQRLVAYLLDTLWTKSPGVLLDPFAGAGTALFAAKGCGWSTKGVEVLPVGIYAMQARLAASRVDPVDFQKRSQAIKSVDLTAQYDPQYAFAHIAITDGAFPQEEERQLTGYISYCRKQIKDNDLQTLLLFGAFSVLEEISYTRKDGQYLRWDYRSGRSQGTKPFDKGTIRPFRQAIAEKLSVMATDLNGDRELLLFSDKPGEPEGPAPELLEGSCLELLPHLAAESIDFVLTSPPYANRYDYTRTYALELVYLGCDHEHVKTLRQTMLSCTVENKNKRDQLRNYYAALGRAADFERVNRTFEEQAALLEVLSILDHYRVKGELNNPHIFRLVQNYFYEMCFVLFELARLTRKGGIVAMVNDNVRYAGEEIPVDLIMSSVAEAFGLTTRHIWTLGRGKGNSSQQMGSHGRSELRKCVYVWQKR